MELGKVEDEFRVKEVFYLDRIRGGQYYAVPKRLTSKTFKEKEALSVVEEQLDKHYYGLEFSNELIHLTKDEFIQHGLKSMQRKYRFLILVGEGEFVHDMPVIIKTRFKNRMHRSIYMELNYCGNGKGVIADCHYYDRIYKERSIVIPEMLSTVYFEYNRHTILNIVNYELNGNFSDIIFVTDGSINIQNKIALCGNI